MLSGSRDTTLRLWRSADAKCLTVLEDHNDFVTCCDFGQGGDFAVSGCEDWSLKVGLGGQLAGGSRSPARPIARWLAHALAHSHSRSPSPSASACALALTLT